MADRDISILAFAENAVESHKYVFLIVAFFTLLSIHSKVKEA